MKEDVMNNKCTSLRIRSNNGKAYYYCLKKRTIFDFKLCLNCLNKKYKNTFNKISKTNKVTKATAISKKIKLIVWERDKHKCIFCQTPVSWNCANSHFIKLSQLGLGIEENIFVACPTCHHYFDDTPKREFLLPISKEYLMSKYVDWNEEMCIW